MPRSSCTVFRCGILCFGFLLASILQAPLWGASAKPQASALPTPAAGESWLSHLHRSFDDTSMGKTGRLGPPAAAPVDDDSGLPTAPGEQITLRGADLYRLNCRACHGEDGKGAPPEINSVINPVRATSAAAIMEQMKARGMEIPRADAAKLAVQSRTMLLDRLHHGGHDMPAFPHLRDGEVDALVAYLRLLAGVPGAEREQRSVGETRAHAGEHIVKSTCHICHAAAGPNPGPEQLSQGAFPPLSTLTRRMSEAQFVRKVTQGAPVRMGTPSEVDRGRMPVFYYLSEDEAADAYLYLSQYPPYRFATLDAAAAPAPESGPADPEPKLANVAYSAGATGTELRKEANRSRAKLAAVLALVGLAALFLLGSGLGFTIVEIRRLAAEQGPQAHPLHRLRQGNPSPRVPEPAATDDELVA